MIIYDLLKIVSACFNRLNIPYFVTGSVASIAYGEARFTNDIDLAVFTRNSWTTTYLSHYDRKERFAHIMITPKA